MFTLLLRAFLRKNALQLSQVIAPKLYPSALSPQTAQSFGTFVSVPFDPFVGRTNEELLEVGESHIVETLLTNAFGYWLVSMGFFKEFVTFRVITSDILVVYTE